MPPRGDEIALVGWTPSRGRAVDNYELTFSAIRPFGSTLHVYISGGLITPRLSVTPIMVKDNQMCWSSVVGNTEGFL